MFGHPGGHLSGLASGSWHFDGFSLSMALNDKVKETAFFDGSRTCGDRTESSPGHFGERDSVTKRYFNQSFLSGLRAIGCEQCYIIWSH
jgi:hypothetical protein